MPLKFVLAEKPVAIKWPITIPVPQNGGAIKKHRIVGLFLAETNETQRARWEAVAEKRNADPHAALKAEDEMLEAVFVGWEEVWGENDQALEFTEETRDLFLSIRYRRDAVIAAYDDFIKGQKAKN